MFVSSLTREWRQCHCHAGYEVSEYGEVRRTTDNRNGRWHLGRIKIQWVRHGYHYVKLPRNKSVKISRLVAFAFLGPPPTPKHEVAHFDGDRSNNHVSNLRWATRKENMQDAVRHGTAPYGENSGRAKLKREDVLEIHREAASGMKQVEIARKHGISPPHVSGILSGKFWHSVVNGLGTVAIRDLE